MRNIVKIKIFLKMFERYIILALLGMLAFVVFLSTIELILVIYKQLLAEPFLLLNIEDLLDFFGLFLVILIGLELIDATKIYLSEGVVHVEVIFLVALIAITRKVIILDVKTFDPLTLFGIAAIILALSSGFFLLKQALKEDD